MNNLIVYLNVVDSYHLSPGWHLDSKHTHASAAAAVPALLIVYMDSHFLVGLQHKGYQSLHESAFLTSQNMQKLATTAT